MAAEPPFTLIAAVARNRVIGREGALPWRLPEDLRRFRRLTLGNIILMGRKTFESLGKPLDGRENWVMSRDPTYVVSEGVRLFGDLKQVLADYASADQGRDLLVIGGAELYRQTLPYARRLELTEVDAEPFGDTFFPEFDRSEWRELGGEDRPADERHEHPYRFITLERRALL